MKCSSCNYPDTRVVRTHLNDHQGMIKRRRECLRCGVRFTTDERQRDIDPQTAKKMFEAGILR